ncbi:hypothetical protein V8C40DRAFT_235802 [Trichoderma camerunense]
MSGPESAHAGGGYDLLRRATQAMMSKYVCLSCLCVFVRLSAHYPALWKSPCRSAKRLGPAIIASPTIALRATK